MIHYESTYTHTHKHLNRLIARPALLVGFDWFGSLGASEAHLLAMGRDVFFFLEAIYTPTHIRTQTHTQFSGCNKIPRVGALPVYVDIEVAVLVTVFLNFLFLRFFKF